MATILIACRTVGKTDEVKKAIGPGHEYVHIRRLDDFLGFLKMPTEKVHVIILLASITHWQSSNTRKIIATLLGYGLLPITIARSSHESFRNEVMGKGLFAVIDDDQATLHETVERVLATKCDEKPVESS